MHTRNDAAPRRQRSAYAGLSDRDALLLHCLVDRRAVLVVHLVELVDQTHAFIRQHKRAALEGVLARH